MMSILCVCKNHITMLQVKYLFVLSIKVINERSIDQRILSSLPDFFSYPNETQSTMYLYLRYTLHTPGKLFIFTHTHSMHFGRDKSFFAKRCKNTLSWNQMRDIKNILCRWSTTIFKPKKRKNVNKRVNWMILQNALVFVSSFEIFLHIVSFICIASMLVYLRWFDANQSITLFCMRTECVIITHRPELYIHINTSNVCVCVWGCYQKKRFQFRFVDDPKHCLLL